MQFDVKDWNQITKVVPLVGELNTEDKVIKYLNNVAYLRIVH